MPTYFSCLFSPPILIESLERFWDLFLLFWIFWFFCCCSWPSLPCLVGFKSWNTCSVLPVLTSYSTSPHVPQSNLALLCHTLAYPASTVLLFFILPRSGTRNSLRPGANIPNRGLTQSGHNHASFIILLFESQKMLFFAIIISTSD